jgi:predicted trehalose synthase
MNFSHRFLPLIGLLAIACASCGEDPKLVEKREKQKAEISRLKGEVSLIEERMKSLPLDVSAELAEAKKVTEKQAAEVSALEAEVASLEANKRSLQSEYDAYQVKYQAK